MLRYGLLGLLNYNDLTGYEMTKTFEDSISFFWNVTMSQVYRELAKMLENGWVEFSVVVQTEKPNKKVYSITESGREELLKWLFEYNGASYFVTRNSFLVNLFFSGLKDISENIKMLRQFREDCLAHAESIAKTEQIIADYSDSVTDEIHTEYWDIVADLGRSQIRETINWVDRSIKRLEERECL